MSAEQSQQSESPSASPERSGRYAARRQVIIIGAVVLLAGVGFSLVQPTAVETSEPWYSVHHWADPIERNSLSRTTLVGGGISAVYSLPNQPFVWAVGQSGLVLRSRNGGRSWRADSITHIRVPAPYTVVRTEKSTKPLRIGDVVPPSDRDSIDVAPNLTRVCFRDARYGWIAGEAGSLFATTDSGTTWKQVETPARAAIARLRCNGPGALVITDRGDLLRVSIGSSISVRSAPSRLHDVDWDGPNRLVAVSMTQGMLSSTNDGQSWTPAASSSPQMRWATLSGPRSAFGGNDSSVFQTTDGGRTWRPAPCRPIVNDGSRGHLSPAFSQDVGFAGLIASNELWTTRNAWRTCERAPFVSEVTSLSARAGKTWYAASREGVFRSADSGHTWAPIALHRRFESIAFVDSVTGWAGLSDGRVARTKDAGRTWTAVDVDPSRIEPILHLTARTKDEVIARIDSGPMYRSGDGGKSWAQIRPDSEVSVRSDSAWRVVNDTLYHWDGKNLSFVAANRRAAVSISAATIYALDTQGRFIVTHDGHTWAYINAVQRRYPAPWIYVFIVVVIGLTTVLARIATPSQPEEETVADALVSDRPLREGDRDALGFATIAATVSRFIRNTRTQPPLTIAVTGPWGSGKSSLMGMVRRDLENRGCRTIWFNAWHHQREESLLAALLEAIRLTATPAIVSVQGIRFRVKLLTKRFRRYAGPLTIMIPLFTGAVFYLAKDRDRIHAVGDGVGAVYRFFTAPDSVRSNVQPANPDHDPIKTIFAVLISLTGLVLTYGKGLKAFGVNPGVIAKSLAAAGRITTVESQPGFRYRFAADFREVTSALAPERLVIFIDDLDRCQPPQVLEILEAVNFLTESGDCIVVLGIDRQRVTGCVAIAFQAIAEAFKKLEQQQQQGIVASTWKPEQSQLEYAESYLEKLINIAVAVPATKAQGVTAVMDTKSPVAPGPPLLRQLPYRRFRVPMQAAATVLFAALLAFAGWNWPNVAESSVTIEEPGGVQQAGIAEPNPSSGSILQVSTTASTPSSGYHQPRYVVAGTMPTVVWWQYVVLTLAGMGLLVWVLVPREEFNVSDSQIFSRTLNAWESVLFKEFPTPRAGKKFLNHLRFLAMAQRQPVSARAPIDKAFDRMSRWPVFKQVAKALGREEDEIEDGPLKSGEITEAALVSLSIVARRHPDWLRDPLFWKTDIRQFERANRKEPDKELGESLTKLEALGKELPPDQSADLFTFSNYQAAWDKLADWVRV